MPPDFAASDAGDVVTTDTELSADDPVANVKFGETADFKNIGIGELGAAAILVDLDAAVGNGVLQVL